MSLTITKYLAGLLAQPKKILSMWPSYMEILSLYIDDLAQRLFKQWLQFLTQGSTACLTKENWKPYIEIFVPQSSVGKESACNAGDPSSIPGLRRSTGGGIGYPLQYSWASLVAQLVKNPPAMWGTWIRSLGWEDSPGEGKGCPLYYSGLENSMDCIVHGVTKSRTRLSHFHFYFQIYLFLYKPLIYVSG